jgi:hypothetical protein
MDPTETDKLHITTALRQPATMALVLLERYATRPATLDFIRATEALGKCRWQVLNQVRTWQAAEPAERGSGNAERGSKNQKSVKLSNY